MSRMEVLDELQELHEQKAELTRQLQLLHSNLQGVSIYQQNKYYVVILKLKKARIPLTRHTLMPKGLQSRRG